jgi:tryptophanyl-tRNA synthetase
LSNSTATKRVLSGMRPTGRLHIGHYFGALQNWVNLQSNPDYECFYFIADWHALTSDYADTSAVAENTIQITIDYLASGLDPNKSVIFLQSQVPEHAELHLLLSMITPLGWLERIPTYKEALDNITNKDLHTYGFLGYPTLQTADIVMYSEPGKGLFVPVGEDQVSHVEFSRELVRKFNFHNIVLDEALALPENADYFREIELSFSEISQTGGYFAGDPGGRTAAELARLETMVRRRVAEFGIENWLETLGKSLENRSGRPLGPNKSAFSRFLKSALIEPQVVLTPTPRIPGLDGRKMSKSYNNAITLSESDADIRSKTKVMKTDPARQRRTDPGNPDVCPVYDWHKLFSPPETLKWAAEGCRTAGIGCIECKSAMADNLIKWITPVRERRLNYEQNPKKVLEILDAGSATARESAKTTMSRVREAVFNWQRKRAEL